MSDSNNSKNELPDDASSGFLSHLIEMRDRLLRAVIVIFVAFVCLFPFAKNIYNWLAAPLVNQGQEMLIIGPVAPFLIPMKLTLMVAFLIALPYLFYQLWSFVAPGLYRHEKRLIYPLIASSIFLFYLGIAFVYYIMLPMLFKIIPQFAPEVAVFSPDIAQYLDFTIMMFMAFGFGFEMPIATILLISTGVTTAEDLKQKRPYVIVAAFVIGMLLTPPDVISQVMLAIPMWLLFEVGIIFSRFFNTRIKEASEAKENMNTAKTAAATSAAALSADELWKDENDVNEAYDADRTIHNEDDNYDEDNNETGHNEYTDDDTFDMSSPSTTENDLDNTKGSDNNTNLDNNLDKNQDNEDYTPEESGEISDSEAAETFYGTDVVEDFDELSDEEMDAELDHIEADEDAEKDKD